MEVAVGAAAINITMSTALVCYKMADALKQQIALARHNSKQCKLLGRRVDALVEVVKGLEDKNFNDQPTKYVNSLKRFQVALDTISQFVIKNQKKMRLRRFLSASSIAENFAGLNEELAIVLSELNVSIQAERIFKREDDEKALKADLAELSQGFEEIRRAETALVDEAIGGLLSRADKDELHLKKIAAIDAALEKALNPDTTKSEPSLIAPELIISFNDLSFKQRIGEGGFGKIFLGELFHAPVVIKDIDGLQNVKIMNEFKREVQIMSALRSPYVVQFFGACTELDRACIVMEHLPEGSLTGYLTRNPKLSLIERHKIMLGIAKGLGYLHSHGVIHRDVKSENVLITANGAAKLADFGLAKSRASHVNTSESATQTAAYTSPEVINNQTYTARSEVFSLGMLLWEVIEGVRPFARAGLSDIQIIKAIRAGKRETLSADFSEPYGDIIRRCWSASPAARPTIPEIVGILSRHKPAAVIVNDCAESADALFAQAQRYEFVNGVSRAADYYEQAIRAGHVEANTNLGLLLHQGKGGLSKNPARANQLWETAAKSGHLRAMRNLIAQYGQGDGVPINAQRQAHWQAELQRREPTSQTSGQSATVRQGMFSRGRGRGSAPRSFAQSPRPKGY